MFSFNFILGFTVVVILIAVGIYLLNLIFPKEGELL